MLETFCNRHWVVLKTCLTRIPMGIFSGHHFFCFCKLATFQNQSPSPAHEINFSNLISFSSRRTNVIVYIYFLSFKSGDWSNTHLFFIYTDHRYTGNDIIDAVRKKKMFKITPRDFFYYSYSICRKTLIDICCLI